MSSYQLLQNGIIADSFTYLHVSIIRFYNLFKTAIF